MQIAIQYLEGGTPAAEISPGEARRRLRAAFDCLPLEKVLVGWDLPAILMESVAEECALHKAALYLWQPLLTSQWPDPPDPSWRVTALDGKPLPEQKPEFTFLCPNQPGARESILRQMSSAIAEGHYQGIFLDRIRFPSPAKSPERHLGCFCPACCEIAGKMDLDLNEIRWEILRLVQTLTGRHDYVRMLLSSSTLFEPQGALEKFLRFRQQSISSFVSLAAQAAREADLRVGLDCFSPGLARMVGQDLAALSTACDWIKVMTYLRALGPASIPYELLGLADWLAASEEESESAALGCLAEAARWSLPATREGVLRGGLPASILTEELHQGRSACAVPLLAGIELVEMPGVCILNETQVRADAAALHTAAPDGVVFSWDLLLMPPKLLRLAGDLLASRG
jgi:hypothetical protein